jgi:membrane protein DedA with SNARE-associated domain
VFVLAMLDSAGVPLPATVDVLVVTFAAVNPHLAYYGAVAAIAGSTIGCTILFYIARKGGELYLDKHTRTGRALKFRQWFLHYGLVTVFIPALIPIPLPTKVFVISAGVFGVRTVPFVMVILAARIPRYFGLAFVGFKLGENSTAWLRQHVWSFVAVAAGLFVLLLLLVKIGERFRRPSVT